MEVRLACERGVCECIILIMDVAHAAPRSEACQAFLRLGVAFRRTTHCDFDMGYICTVILWKSEDGWRCHSNMTLRLLFLRENFNVALQRSIAPPPHFHQKHFALLERYAFQRSSQCVRACFNTHLAPTYRSPSSVPTSIRHSAETPRSLP